MRSPVTLVVATVVLVAATRLACAAEDPEKAVSRVLDDFHAAASAADEDRYLGHLAPDGMFLGTDASERWTVAEFREFVHPYFSEGRGWTYVALERHVAVSQNGKLAWFDETLRNEKYGTLRGSGVLRRTGSVWKIVQYNMTFLVPNAVAPDVVDLIRGASDSPAP
jgi:ketosteroid isomerase-like protein